MLRQMDDLEQRSVTVECVSQKSRRSWCVATYKLLSHLLNQADIQEASRHTVFWPKSNSELQTPMD